MPYSPTSQPARSSQAFDSRLWAFPQQVQARDLGFALRGSGVCGMGRGPTVFDAEVFDEDVAYEAAGSQGSDVIAVANRALLHVFGVDAAAEDLRRPPAALHSVPGHGMARTELWIALDSEEMAESTLGCGVLRCLLTREIRDQRS